MPKRTYDIALQAAFTLWPKPTRISGLSARNGLHSPRRVVRRTVPLSGYLIRGQAACRGRASLTGLHVQLVYACCELDMGLLLESFDEMGFVLTREDPEEDLGNLRFLLRDFAPPTEARKRIEVFTSHPLLCWRCYAMLELNWVGRIRWK